jgi:hypothetical protein
MPRRITPLGFGLASLLLAGCVPNAPPPAPEPLPPSDTAADQCGAGKLGRYLNLLPTSDAMSDIRAAVGERPIRTIRPGDAVTMDFAPGRLNMELGGDGRIKRFRCG